MQAIAESSVSADTSANLYAMYRQSLANMQVDILSQIFLLLSRDSEPLWKEGRSWDWITIAEVCRYWHAVTTGTPKLWAFLDKFHRTNRFQIFLKLSKDADLSVVYDDRQRVGRGEFGNLKMAMKEMGRIGYLSLAAQIPESQAVDLLSYFEIPAPRMHTIEISTAALDSFRGFQLPCTTPGVLNYIALENMRFSSLISGLTRVSNLALTHCDFALEELLDVLSSSPGLEVIHIASCNIDCSNCPTTEPIHLPELTVLDIQLYKFSVGHKLFQLIAAPNISLWIAKFSTKISLKNIWKLDVFSSVVRSDYFADLMSIKIHHCVDPEAENLKSSFKMLMGQHTDTEMEANCGDLELHFDQKTDMNAVVRRWIKVFSSYLTTMSLLDIETSDDTVTAESWESVFQACASIKTLKVHLGYEDHYGGHFLEALGRVTQHEDQDEDGELGESISGPLPNLEHLVVYWNGHWDDTDDPELFVRALEEMLEQRRMNGRAVRRVTVHSDDAEESCEQDEELEEDGVLSAWAEEIRRTRKMQEEYFRKLLGEGR